MNNCKTCDHWKSNKLDPSPVAGRCVKLETGTGSLFGCVHWKSAQQKHAADVRKELSEAWAQDSLRAYIGAMIDLIGLEDAESSPKQRKYNR